MLGSLPADEISIRETSDGQGAFVADMRINLWQKRMRVSGRVSVEFIARGMILLITGSLATHSLSSRPDMVSHVFLAAVHHSDSSGDVESRALLARAQSTRLCPL